jgi:hypothetical protein
MLSVVWNGGVRMAQILSVMNGVRISLEQLLTLLRWNLNCIEEQTFFLQTVELKKVFSKRAVLFLNTSTARSFN